MKKKILIISIIGISILLTGCWDMVEINQRIFPYSVGVDLNDGEGPDYIVTISYININAIGKNATQEDRVFVVSTPASSIFEASKILSTKVAYPFYFKHLRVLILGQEVVNDEHHVREIMDGLRRDYRINKKLMIATAEDKAKEILEAVPNATKQEEIEGTLFALLNDTKTKARYTSITLSDFIQGMHMLEVIAPRIKVDGTDIRVFGGCVFKHYKMVGHINEIENRSIAFLRDRVQMELVDVPYEDTFISYEITGQNMKKKLVKNEDELTMEIHIEINGTLQGYILMGRSKISDDKDIQAMEKAIEKTLEKEILHAIDLTQKKYKSDVIGVGEYISKYHPKVWKEISENWYEYFEEMEIKVKLDPKIERRGLTQ